MNTNTRSTAQSASFAKAYGSSNTANRDAQNSAEDRLDAAISKVLRSRPPGIGRDVSHTVGQYLTKDTAANQTMKRLAANANTTLPRLSTDAAGWTTLGDHLRAKGYGA